MLKSLTMRVYTKLVLLSALFFLAACASAPEVTPTLLPTATQTPAPTATRTATSTPTPTPTPIGSASYPLVGVVQNRSIQIIELETERVIATIPYTTIGNDFYNFVRFSPDGRQLAYSDGLSIQTYNLETGETTHLFSLPEGAYLENIEWSPSSKWLNYSFYFYGETTNRIWVHSLSNSRSAFISRGYFLDWLPNEDRFLYQNTAGSWFIHNPATAAEQTPPRIRLDQKRIESHSFHFSNMGCTTCYLLELNAFELHGYALGKNEVYFHLFDAETRAEKAFVAHFVSELPAREGYFVHFHDMLALNRGDYILYITEVVGKHPDWTHTPYSIWNPTGSLPIEVSFENDANRLADVMPVELSADESAFIGFHPSGVVIVDITTADIIYNYQVSFLWSNRTVGHAPAGIDLHWGD